MFKKAKSQSEAAVQAGFIVAQEITISACPFTEGKFIKESMIKILEVVCPDEKQAFLTASSCSNTVADEVADNQTTPAKGKGKRPHCLFPYCG